MKTPLAFLLLIIFSISTIFAQSGIEGAVSTMDGEELAFVNIALIEVANKEVVILKETDEFGYFELSDIPDGVYEIYFSLPTYKSATIEHLYFPKDRDKVFNLLMEEDTKESLDVEVSNELN